MDTAANGRVTGWQVLNEPSVGSLSLPESVDSYEALFDFIVALTAGLRAALPGRWFTGPAWCNVFDGGETDGLLARATSTWWMRMTFTITTSARRPTVRATASGRR